MNLKDKILLKIEEADKQGDIPRGTVLRSILDGLENKKLPPDEVDVQVLFGDKS